MKNDIKEEIRDFDYYNCEKCNEKVSNNFMLEQIKDTGLCPTCYYECT